MVKFNILAGLTVMALASGCARTEPMQPDRAVFNVDASYQRAHYSQPIETTFDRTVAVFRESGYKLDIVDRATGQVSGRRGHTGDKGVKSDTDLRFYAIVLPEGEGSQIALRIAQIASQGIPVLNQSRTEVILNQPELYAYIFRRIEAPAATAAQPVAADVPPATETPYPQ